MFATMHQTKLHIPLTLPSPSDTSSASSSDRSSSSTINIVGILTQISLPKHHASHDSVDHRVSILYPLAPVSPSTTRGRKIALILHGVLAHKDQTYHRLLASRLPMDSFRFDFRANAETPGPWNMASFDLDLHDIRTCVAFLTQTLGYQVELIVAHSRGALDAFKYLATECGDDIPPESRVPYYVALGARWRMQKIHDRDRIYAPAFASEGFYRWKVKVAGQEREVHIFPKDVEDFASWPIEDYVRRFPTKTDVLLIAGTSDETVPVSDASYYMNALTSSSRRPGSATLRMIDGANHNFKGYFEELVDIITSWIQQKLGPGQDHNDDVSITAGVLRDCDVRLQQSWSHNAAAGSLSDRGKL